MKRNWYKTIIDTIGLTIGVFLLSIGIVFFLEPNAIAPGGITGFAIVIKQFTGFPVYLTNLIINIPLFIIGIMKLGKNFGWKTAYATAILSFFLKLIPPQAVTPDHLLACIFGGVLSGLGLGMVFRFGGTTGGSDLIGALLTNRFPNISIGTFMMIVDGMVVVFAGVAAKNVETSLYSIIALFTTVKVIDMILEGIGYLKAFLIITTKPDEISEKIMVDLDRGVTLFKGKGMYTKEEKDILLCVVSRSQFTKTKDIVNSIDRDAFIMVTEISEVLGEGFEEVKSQ
jgi:uncharacterized membrane-anchored protein YitT (DUF2179 family)